MRALAASEMFNLFGTRVPNEQLNLCSGKGFKYTLYSMDNDYSLIYNKDYYGKIVDLREVKLYTKAVRRVLGDEAFERDVLDRDLFPEEITLRIAA